MDRIERAHGLIAELTDADEGAIAAAEAKLAPVNVPEFALRGQPRFPGLSLPTIRLSIRTE